MTYITAPAGLFEAFIRVAEMSLDRELIDSQEKLGALIESHSSVSPVVAFFIEERSGACDRLIPVSIYHWHAGSTPPSEDGASYKAVGSGTAGAKRELADVVRGFWPHPQDPEL